MNAGGWIFFVVSTAFVWGLTIWCFYRVLSSPEVAEEMAEELEHFHNP
jgi:hypothetical protein